MKKNGLKIVAALIGAYGAYLVYRYIRQNKKGDNIITNPNYVISVPEPTKITETDYNKGTDRYPLAKGSVGSNVKLLQEALKGLVMDGIFGSKTEAALIAKTGKKSVASQKEIESIAISNGFGFKIDSNGKLVLIPKEQQNILYKSSQMGNKLPLFGDL